MSSAPGVPLARLAISGLLLLAASPGFANWPTDPTVNVPLCTAPGDQYEPQSVSDGAGGSIVVWYDLRTPSHDYDIYVQRVDVYGHVMWTTNGVAACYLDSIQAVARITTDGAGGAIVTWTDGRSGNYDVYAQRINSAGVPQWTPNGVQICGAANHQVANSIVSDGAGGALIAWSDARNGVTSDIFVRRVSSAGVPQWTANGVAVCAAAADQNNPTMIADGSGGAIVTWIDYRGGASTPDIYARRINSSGVPQWTVDGVALCTAAGSQIYPEIAGDGSGGAIVTWQDERLGSSNPDIYVRRVDSSGLALWTANGVALCTHAAGQYKPVIVADAAGGAIVSWTDYRSSSSIYAQRVNSAGAPLWTANGVGVCTATQMVAGAVFSMVSDGAGGALIAWGDYRVTSLAGDVYAQRLNSSGAAMWTTNGIAISTAGGDQSEPTLVGDGTGGAVFAWVDSRSGAADIYSGRCDGTGYLGISEPILDDVRDVANDQGGKVIVLWEPSGLDVGPSTPIESYTLWRRIVATPAQQAAAREAAEARPGAIRSRVEGAETIYWEYIVAIPARGAPGYAYTVATGSDSMPGSIPWNVFFVEAKKGTIFYTSRTDSGYSVDNLSPAAPAPFTGNATGGTTRLHWNPNGESDLFEYRLYRGSSSGFVPAPGNLISAQADTGYTDTDVGFFYKLSAVDVHGNESPYALLSPQQTTDVPFESSAALLLTGTNPARGEARLRFVLPRRGTARLVVFDAAGREVKVLAEGMLEAGEHGARWDGRETNGRAVASGFYLARLTWNDESRERRFVLVR